MAQMDQVSGGAESTPGLGLQYGDGETAPQKLTTWKNEPQLTLLKADFEAARPSHMAHVARVEEWTDLLHVRGRHRPREVKGRSRVQPKLVRRQAEWRYSALTEPFLSATNLFKVDPATWHDVDAARQNGMVLNWQFRSKINRVNFFDNYVRATVDEGTCIVKVGWKRHTIKVTENVPIWAHYPLQNPQDIQTFQQALQTKQQDPKGFEQDAPPEIKAAIELYEESQQATVARQTGTKPIESDKVIENRPTLDVIHPKNLFSDPSCNGDIDKCNFAIHSFDTSKGELLKEPEKYNKARLELVNWNANSPATEPDHYSQTPPDFALQDTLRRKVVAYEYWGFYDVEGNGELVPIVCTWIGDTIIRMDLNPYPDDKIPFVIVPYMPIKRELNGEPDAELLGDNQAILGAVTRGMIDLLGRSANGQQGIAKGMLDPLNRRRYENGQDYEFNPNMSPENGIIEHKYPELPRSALEMAQIQNQEAESLTGVKAFSGGLSGSSLGPTAAAAKGVLDASAKRESSILRRLAKGMEQIGNKIIAMNTLFLSEEETIMVTAEQFVTVKRDDLKGQFNLIVDINTAEMDDQKAQDLAFMVQTCGPVAGTPILLMLMAEIADLKRMPELAHKLRNYQPPPPDPMQQQMQQLQIQQLQAEVSRLQSEVQLNQAKAQYEGSRKDKTDLDFVEQETGTNHARKLQEIEAQGRNQQAVHITKALTTPRKEGETAPNLNAAVNFNKFSTQMMNPSVS